MPRSSTAIFHQAATFDWTSDQIGAVVVQQGTAMPHPDAKDEAIDLISEALISRLEASTDLLISAPAKNLAQQRQRWLKLDRYAGDIAALTRSLQILNR